MEKAITLPTFISETYIIVHFSYKDSTSYTSYVVEQTH